MKLRKRLTHSGSDLHLISCDVRLDLRTPGRAQFRVKSTAPLSGGVSLALGYSGQDTDVLFFVGDIESSHTVDGSTQRIVCRETAARLDAALPISLRHPDLHDVLAAYTEASAVRFAVPARSYAHRPVATFQALGTGYHGLDSLGGVFGIEDYLWQQQGDGSVFVGSWADSRWATRPIDIPDAWFTGTTSDGSRKLPAIPALRPGVLLGGQRVIKVQLAGHEMVVTCSTP
jgi:hypothetical protein